MLYVKLMALLFVIEHIFVMNQCFVWMLKLAVSVKTSPDKTAIQSHGHIYCLPDELWPQKQFD